MAEEVERIFEERRQRLLREHFNNPLMDICLAAIAKHDDGDIEIPRTYVAPCESLETVIPRLSSVLITPTGQTQFHLPGMQEDLKKWDRIVTSIDADHAAYGSCIMLDILHSAQTGHEYHPVWVFADEARMFPQYACDWLRDLCKIYGYRQLGDVSFSHQYDKFFGILNETQEIAEMYLGCVVPNLAESVTAAVQHVADCARSDGQDAVEALESVSRHLDKRFVSYRAAVNMIRGFPSLN